MPWCPWRHHLITWDYRSCRGPGDRLHPTLTKAALLLVCWTAKDRPRERLLWNTAKAIREERTSNSAKAGGFMQEMGKSWPEMQRKARENSASHHSRVCCSASCNELAQNFTLFCHMPVEPVSSQKPQSRAFPWAEHFCSGKFEELPRRHREHPFFSLAKHGGT